MVANVIYLKGNGDVRGDLLSAINEVGGRIDVATNIDEVYDSIAKKTTTPLLLVDASAGDREAATRIVELSDARALFPCPVIFLSYQAMRRSALLQRQFPQFRAIDVPFEISEILAEVKWFVERSADCRLLEGSSIEEEQIAVELETRDDPLPSRPPLSVTIYGGEILSTGGQLDNFDDADLIPSGHPDRMRVREILMEITRHSPWLGLHSRRAALLASRIAKGLQFGWERDSNVRLCSLLCGWAAVRHGSRPLDAFLDREGRDTRGLASLYERSAEMMLEKLQDRSLCDTVSAMSEILRNSSAKRRPTTVLDAQCVLVIDLIDRTCWNTGWWDPFGANRSLRKLRGGAPFSVDGDILACTVNVLSEATETAESRAILSRFSDRFHPGNSAQLISDAVREAEMLFWDVPILTTTILGLRPGMVLSRPLVTADGKLLLRANTVFTDELLVRLIQLATIRPIAHPIAVLDLPA